MGFFLVQREGIIRFVDIGGIDHQFHQYQQMIITV